MASRVVGGLVDDRQAVEVPLVQDVLVRVHLPGARGGAEPAPGATPRLRGGHALSQTTLLRL